MTRTAVIAGVGPGLGESIARRFAAAGCRVGLFARSGNYLQELAADLAETPGEGLAVETDLRDPAAIEAGFEAVRDAFGPVDVLVHHASAAGWDGLLEIDPGAFERSLDVGPRAALHTAREAASDMVGDDNDGGTIVFTGATTSVRGREGAIGFSASKFAIRGMAESMARELGPEGVHVAHVVLDGMILTPAVENAGPDRPREDYLDPDAIAESYWHLVEQDRSAWTLELDLRPHVEEF
jgi:NAD(P)-dependent dehydrogenase (short-subunit alcohol dehydrogenase family)